AVVQVEKVSGPAKGAGGAVDVQRFQIVWVAGQAADRGDIGVVARGVSRYFGQQRQRAQVVVADDGVAWAGEAQGGAGFAPGSVGALWGADARTYAWREPGWVDGGGQDDAHVAELCRLYRAGRANQVADLVERKS